MSKNAYFNIEKYNITTQARLIISMETAMIVSKSNCLKEIHFLYLSLAYKGTLYTSSQNIQTWFEQEFSRWILNISIAEAWKFLRNTEKKSCLLAIL